MLDLATLKVGDVFKSSAKSPKNKWYKVITVEKDTIYVGRAIQESPMEQTFMFYKCTMDNWFLVPVKLKKVRW
jgi:hypothetical protein